METSLNKRKTFVIRGIILLVIGIIMIVLGIIINNLTRDPTITIFLWIGAGVVMPTGLVIGISGSKIQLRRMERKKGGKKIYTSDQKKRKKQRNVGIILLVIGLGCCSYPGYLFFMSGITHTPIFITLIFFIGLVLCIIGLILLIYNWQSQEQKPSRLKQVKPIT